MENLIKFLEDKITDKMSVEEIVDVFEQMCSTPLEEDMVLFETGTFTAFSKEPFFQISLVRQFSNDDEELCGITRNNISCNDGRIYYLLSWKNRWRYI